MNPASVMTIGASSRNREERFQRHMVVPRSVLSRLGRGDQHFNFEARIFEIWIEIWVSGRVLFCF